jgi:hypothetical protein
MHAESHIEILENKGEGRRKDNVDFVKFREIANTVNSLDVYVEFGRYADGVGLLKKYVVSEVLLELF